MPQQDVLLPWRQVIDNAAIGLEVVGWPRERARAEARKLLEPFGLSGAESLYPRQLSGGMRQRVSFLRTVVHDRPVLLLDVPFVALDAIILDVLILLLVNIWQLLQISFLATTIYY